MTSTHGKSAGGRGYQHHAREISRRAGESAARPGNRQEGGYIGRTAREIGRRARISAARSGNRQHSMDISITLGKSAGERGYRQHSDIIGNTANISPEARPSISSLHY
ncbi:hypothetical protein ACFOGI_05260 [Virgibacillus xinjiangensis]|uniref:Uncharacterized protein n=1 Tax=Virgibacillus xinjiangensis TaxID=393090 RepID=A0ABV7CTR3_9BACI